MKYWRIIAGDLKKKPSEVGAVCQPWIVAGAQSGLQTRIAATEGVSLCDADEELMAFMELHFGTSNYAELF